MKVSENECVFGWFSSQVCGYKPSKSTFFITASLSCVWTFTLCLSSFISFSFSQQQFSALFIQRYLSLCVPPGNFKEGIHAQKHFPSLLQASGIFVVSFWNFSVRCLLHPPSKQNLISSLSFFVALFLNCWSNSLDSSVCSASDISHLVGWWGGLFHCCVHDLILLKAILASIVQSWKADVLVVNRGRPFSPHQLFLHYWPGLNRKSLWRVLFLLGCLLLCVPHICQRCHTQ